MNWNAIKFDWNHLRAFLATAEEGSLSAAARALGLTQPTLSRQISTLETDLQLTLFERNARSMTLTSAGHNLLDHTRAMGDAAMKLSLAASGQSDTIAGHVVISATDMASSYHLPPIIAQARAQAPTLTVEVLTSNEISDLIKREADIAIRHAEPTTPELIAKKLSSVDAYIYGSVDYFKHHPIPKKAADLSGHIFIGSNPVNDYLPALNAAGLDLKADQFQILSNNGMTVLAMVQQGLGLTILPKNTGDLIQGLMPVLTDQFAIPIPIWLVTHRELRTNPRIRFMFDLISDNIS